MDDKKSDVSTETTKYVTSLMTTADRMFTDTLGNLQVYYIKYLSTYR